MANLILSEEKALDIQELANISPIPLLGGLAGLGATTAEFAIYPFHNIQIRIQMNGSQGLPVYNSTFDCILKTFKTSGWSGFFRGFGSAVLRQFPDSIVRYSFYEKMKRYEIQTHGQLSSLKNTLYGGLGGTLGTLIGTPAEIIKVRMVNDFLGTEYNGILDCAIKTYRFRGFRGFYRGLDANIARNAIMNGSELPAYDYFKEKLVDTFNFQENSYVTHLACGTIAGIIGAIATSPPEIVKIRYMNQLKTGTIYSNVWQCAKDIYRNEGFFAFYKGFTPFCLMLIPWAQVFFLSYEQYKHYTLPRFVKY